MKVFDDSFALAPDAQAIATRLVLSLDDFEHLFAARIAFVFSERELRVRGDQAAAFIVDPAQRGPLRHLFEWFLAGLTTELFEQDPADYLVLIDRALWSALDSERKERLVYHELRHAIQKETAEGAPMFSEDGRPALRLVRHDTELFDSELQRYGVEICEAEHTAIAIARGENGRRARAKRSA